MAKEAKKIVRGGDGKLRDLGKLQKATKTAKAATKIYNVATSKGVNNVVRKIGGQKAVNKVHEVASRGMTNARAKYEKAGGKFTSIGGIAGTGRSIVSTKKGRNIHGGAHWMYKGKQK